VCPSRVLLCSMRQPSPHPHSAPCGRFGRYNPAYLPGTACADGSAEAEFAGGVVGCDGSWNATSGGLEAAGRELCAAGFELCPSADVVAALGVQTGGCGAAANGTFYVSGETCGGNSSAWVGVWGCGQDGDGAGGSSEPIEWHSDACGVLSNNIFANGSSAAGAWGLVGKSAAGISKAQGNGGVMCCQVGVPLPLGSLGRGINCDDAASGAGCALRQNHMRPPFNGPGNCACLQD
jgi:hypothetical protein